MNGGETVRKGRCPLNPAPPGALAGALAPPKLPAKFRRGALFEACDEATDAPTDEQASGVAPDGERSEAIQNQGRRATGAREIAN